MTRDLLVGIGGCLVVIGFVVRGLARNHRRDQALRKQHQLAASEPGRDAQPDALDRHLEKWLPRYGAIAILAGFALIVTAFVR